MFQEVKLRAIFIILTSGVLAFLVGCAKPLPDDKKDYVGLWKDENVSLQITADGHIKYLKVLDGSRTKIDAPIKGFTGDDFSVGVGPFSTTFKVDRAPYRDGDVWKLEVDGRVLIRTHGPTGPGPEQLIRATPSLRRGSS